MRVHLTSVSVGAACITAAAWAAVAFTPGAIAGPRITPAAASDDGEWTMPGKDYASTRYSELSQITPANAEHLHPVWSFSTGVLGGHEGQPLVVHNTMYVVTPYPNTLYADRKSTRLNSSH